MDMCTCQVYSLKQKYIFLSGSESFIQTHSFLFDKIQIKLLALSTVTVLTQSELFSWKQRRVETIVQRGSQQNV